jgi:periplasmic copper chaperone A
MRSMKRRLFLGLILLPHIAQAHSFKLGSIEIGHAWALPSANGETSAMFPILNMGLVADELIEAKSEIANTIEFRVGDKKVDNFELAPNKPFPMRAAASHLQLMGLTKTLIVDEPFDISLRFKNAGNIKISLYVSEKA